MNVQFNLGGSITNPKIGIKVLSSDGTGTVQDAAKDMAQAAVDKAKDSLQNLANKEIGKAKEKANEVIDKAADSLTNVANRKVDELKDKATQEVKDKVGTVIGKEVGDKVGDKVGEKVGEKAGEVLGDGAKKTVDDVKDKLNNWDPFAKKKKKKE